tara:strand:+ start:295 stop:579 length:285 start_codon:yes stop_codon:yes gene_type:complete
MKISNKDVDDVLAKVRQQLQDDQTLSVSLRTTIELLITLIQILTGRLGTDSTNSSKPPSQDPNRPRKLAAKVNASPVGNPVGSARHCSRLRIRI